MNLSSMLRAHAEWVAHLRETLYGDGVFNRTLVADDEACELGRWLKRIEPRCAGSAEYLAARQAHAGFHRRAAHCMELIGTGRRNDALAETGKTGELRRLSRELVKTLQDLDRAVSAERQTGPQKDQRDY